MSNSFQPATKYGGVNNHKLAIEYGARVKQLVVVFVADLSVTTDFRSPYDESQGFNSLGHAQRA
ncbi:MAG TPA: hypothetical protein V6C69_15265 [Trichormus sp.]